MSAKSSEKYREWQENLFGGCLKMFMKITGIQGTLCPSESKTEILSNLKLR